MVFGRESVPLPGPEAIQEETRLTSPVTIYEVSHCQPIAARLDQIIGMFREPEVTMNAATGNCRSRGHTQCQPAISTFGGLVVAASAMIALTSSGIFGQSPMVNNAPRSEAAVTRQRKVATEASSNDPTLIGDLDRPPARIERRVFVRSTSLLVRAAVVEDKLLKRPEFHQLGFSITRDESDAVVILELRHDLFTKYVFSVVDARTGLVLASGKLSSLGGTVAGKVAKRFVKEMMRSGAP